MHRYISHTLCAVLTLALLLQHVPQHPMQDMTIRNMKLRKLMVDIPMVRPKVSITEKTDELDEPNEELYELPYELLELK